MHLIEKNSLVTVIVPVYNVEDYIAKCIESILKQSYKNLEILLINDGTKDYSREICMKYAEIDKRIRVIDKENGGLSDARNRGINEALGNYYVFVDGDDYIKKDYVKDLLENLLVTESDVSMCPFDIVDDTGKIIITENFNEYKKSTINGHDVLSEVMTDYGYKYVVAWNKIYSKKIFDNIRFDKGKLYEDEYINFKIFWNCNKVGIVDVPLYCYVQRNGSIMQSKMSSYKIENKCGMHRARISFYAEKKDEILYKRACQMYCNWLVECVRSHADALSKKEKKILQKDMRKYVPETFDGGAMKLALKLQNIFGFYSLSLAAKIKTVYMILK